MMGRHARTSFNEVVALYDAVRPGYPAAIVEDIITLANLSAQGQILEVGCGTGQATQPFAQRGYQVVAVELGQEMAAFAKHKFRSYANVDIWQGAFEEWEPGKQMFDLVLAAQAFHWIPPEIGFAKAAAVLRPTGALALLWHRDDSEHTEFWQASNQLYDRYFPPSEGGPSLSKRIFEYRDYVEQLPAFGPVVMREQAWTQSYATHEYLNLMNTFSTHRTLERRAKVRFFAEMAALIEDFGGSVTRHYTTVLVLAYRRSG